MSEFLALPDKKKFFSLPYFEIPLFLFKKVWLAWALLLLGWFYLWRGQELVLSGFCITAGLVLLMNGLGQTELLLGNHPPKWWHEHRVLHMIHHINSEGEMAGVLAGVITLCVLMFGNSPLQDHVHLDLQPFWTLLGIMSAAGLIVQHMNTILNFLEKLCGSFITIFVGSLLSSLTGEPAAAVFLTRYIYTRVEKKYHARVGAALGITIGSGGGLAYYAAPPILIVWYTYLHPIWGWEIVDLWKYVGIGCALHVLLGTFYVNSHIHQHPQNHKQVPKLKTASMLLGFGVLIIAHIRIPQEPGLWTIDALLCVSNILVMRAKYQQRERELLHSQVDWEQIRPEDGNGSWGKAITVHQWVQSLHSDKAEGYLPLEHLQEERFARTWQPLILALLLVALDVVGFVSEEFILSLGHLIPSTWPLWAIVYIMFILTAFVSHFADNALASRVFMVIAVAMTPIFGQNQSAIIAAAIIMGALFGGMLTIPGNLPNFAIARTLRISASEWIRNAIRMYWTAIAYLIVLSFWLFM